MEKIKLHQKILQTFNPIDTNRMIPASHPLYRCEYPLMCLLVDKSHIKPASKENVHRIITDLLNGNNLHDLLDKIYRESWEFYKCSLEEKDSKYVLKLYTKDSNIPWLKRPEIEYRPIAEEYESPYLNIQIGALRNTISYSMEKVCLYFCCDDYFYFILTERKHLNDYAYKRSSGKSLLEYMKNIKGCLLPIYEESERKSSLYCRVIETENHFIYSLDGYTFFCKKDVVPEGYDIFSGKLAPSIDIGKNAYFIKNISITMVKTKEGYIPLCSWTCEYRPEQFVLEEIISIKIKESPYHSIVEISKDRQDLLKQEYEWRLASIQRALMKTGDIPIQYWMGAMFANYDALSIKKSSRSIFKILDFLLTQNYLEEQHLLVAKNSGHLRLDYEHTALTSTLYDYNMEVMSQQWKLNETSLDDLAFVKKNHYYCLNVDMDHNTYVDFMGLSLPLNQWLMTNIKK